MFAKGGELACLQGLTARGHRLEIAQGALKDPAAPPLALVLEQIRLDENDRNKLAILAHGIGLLHHGRAFRLDVCARAAHQAVLIERFIDDRADLARYDFAVHPTFVDGRNRMRATMGEYANLCACTGAKERIRAREVGENSKNLKDPLQNGSRGRSRF